MILNRVDLTHLDVGLDPEEYPEQQVAMNGKLTPDILLTEEMMDLGIMDEREMTQENYLKARREYVVGNLSSLSEMVRLAKRLTEEERRDTPPDWVDEVDPEDEEE